jgi:hypothetical protein
MSELELVDLKVNRQQDLQTTPLVSSNSSRIYYSHMEERHTEEIPTLFATSSTKTLSLYCPNSGKFELFILTIRYGFQSGFGGQPLYEQWLYQLYNVLFTAFPIMWFAIFDQEKSRDEFLEDPKLYKIGLKSKLTNGLINFRSQLWQIQILALDFLRHMPNTIHPDCYHKLT